MYFTHKISTLKKISIIPFLFASIPFIFLYLFLRDVPFLSSLFIEYVNSGNSIFFPYLTSTPLVFHFTTGHLIDIIIVGNIIAFLQRGGYYYVNVCLKRNYLDIYSDINFIDFTKPTEKPSLNPELPLNMKRNSNSLVNDDLYDIFYNRNEICATHLNNKYRLYTKAIKSKLTSFYPHKKLLLSSHYYTSSQYSLTKNVLFYHLPRECNQIISYSNETILKLEGRS